MNPKVRLSFSYTKSSKKWTHFGWFIFGIILLASFTIATTINENNIITSGNITADTYFGDGSQLTGIVAGSSTENNSSYLGNGLVLWYGFEENKLGSNNETAYDSSTSRLNLVLGNGTINNPSIPNYANGIKGYGLEFTNPPNNNQYGLINISNSQAFNGLFNNSNLTFSVWINKKGSNNATNKFGFVLSNPTSGNSYNIVYPNMSTNQLRVSVGSHNYDIYNSTNGKWYHLAFTIIRNSSVNFYIDGELLTTRPSNTTSNTVVNMNIGSQVQIKEFFNGTIDEFKIWNRVLTDQEIRAEYNQLGGNAYGHLAYK